MPKIVKRDKRTFSEQFKKDAVNLVLIEGYSFAAAARAVNITSKSLREWHQKYAHVPEACGDDATVAELQPELRQLWEKPRQAELERDMLDCLSPTGLPERLLGSSRAIEAVTRVSSRRKLQALLARCDGDLDDTIGLTTAPACGTTAYAKE